MIRNGLYHITVEMLAGIEGGNQDVMMLRAGAPATLSFMRSAPSTTLADLLD
jgi:hypothetical protein